jgi:hypothetical protein
VGRLAGTILRSDPSHGRQEMSSTPQQDADPPSMVWIGGCRRHLAIDAGGIVAGRLRILDDRYLSNEILTLRTHAQIIRAMFKATASRSHQSSSFG